MAGGCFLLCDKRIYHLHLSEVVIAFGIFVCFMGLAMPAFFSVIVGARFCLFNLCLYPEMAGIDQYKFWNLFRYLK